MEENSHFDEALFYQKIGEFVVTFQWIEQRIRQIGWFCTDPQSSEFSNLRKESNYELLNNVVSLHEEFIKKNEIDTQDGYQLNFNEVISSFHKYRNFRNKLLHSAYTELKAGGEVQAILRSDIKINKSRKTDGIHSLNTIEEIDKIMKEMARNTMHLNFYYIQLIHWYKG